MESADRRVALSRHRGGEESERKAKISLQSGASLYANARLESPRLENKCKVLKVFKLKTLNNYIFIYFITFILNFL